MSVRRHRPARVLIGDLEPITRLGMSRLFTDAGLEVVPDEDGPVSVVVRAERHAPDAVVLGLDDDGAEDLSRRVRRAAPRAKVILWARDETEMHVLDPASHAPRRVLEGAPDALLGELAEPSP